MSLKGVRQVAASSSPLPGTVVQRDANGNVFANNFGYSQTATVTSATPVVLTAASSGIQVFTGSTAQTVKLPDATTLANGLAFAINNNSSATITLNNAGNSLVVSIPAGGIVEVYVTSIASANGTWDAHPAAPGAVQWGSGTIGLIFNSALSTSPSIAAGASSATAPAFIPQRGAPTTGFGGSGTTADAIIAGVNKLSVTAANGTLMVGTSTNDSAVAGNVGEYVSATTAVTSSGYTSGSVANVASISLTAGDWDVSGVAVFANSGTLLTNTVVVATISLVSGTAGDAAANRSAISLPTPGDPPSTPALTTPIVRLLLAATTTVYLTGQTNFTSGGATMGVGGTIRARRMR